MIISGKQIQNVAKVYGEQNKVAKNTNPQNSRPSQQKDEVILSTQAQEFGQIYQTLKAMGDVREDKVKEISERIAQGNYNVQAKDVAAKMLERDQADRLK